MMIKKIKLPIGLDISDLSIKAIQLTKRSEKTTISGIGKYNLKPGVIENGEILDSKEFVNAIHQLFNKPVFGSFSGNEVVVCLPDVKTYIKLVNIEKTPNKLSVQVGLELEKNFPFNKSEVYFDWQLVNKDGYEDQVLIAATQKSVVEHYIDNIKKAKLEIVAFEVESIAICRCLLSEENPNNQNVKKEPEKKNYCLIDIGAKRTSLTVYSKDTIISSVSLPISGNETTKLISSALEIEHEEAEKAKIICGLDKSQAHGIIANILSDMTNTLIDKIEQTVNFYYKNYPERGVINEIILCGGGSNIKFLNKTITTATGIETNIGNPLANITSNTEDVNKYFLEKHRIDTSSIKEMGDDFLTKKQSTATNYTTAIGLSLRNCFITKI